MNILLGARTDISLVNRNLLVVGISYYKSCAVHCWPLGPALRASRPVNRISHRHVYFTCTQRSALEPLCTARGQRPGRILSINGWQASRKWISCARRRRLDGLREFGREFFSHPSHASRPSRYFLRLQEAAPVLPRESNLLPLRRIRCPGECCASRSLLPARPVHSTLGLGLFPRQHRRDRLALSRRPAKPCFPSALSTSDWLASR